MSGAPLPPAAELIKLSDGSPFVLTTPPSSISCQNCQRKKIRCQHREEILAIIAESAPRFDTTPIGGRFKKKIEQQMKKNSARHAEEAAPMRRLRTDIVTLNTEQVNSPQNVPPPDIDNHPIKKPWPAANAFTDIENKEFYYYQKENPGLSTASYRRWFKKRFNKEVDLRKVRKDSKTGVAWTLYYKSPLLGTGRPKISRALDEASASSSHRRSDHRGRVNYRESSTDKDYCLVAKPTSSRRRSSSRKTSSVISYRESSTEEEDDSEHGEIYEVNGNVQLSYEEGDKGRTLDTSQQAIFPKKAVFTMGEREVRKIKFGRSRHAKETFDMTEKLVSSEGSLATKTTAGTTPTTTADVDHPTIVTSTGESLPSPGTPLNESHKPAETSLVDTDSPLPRARVSVQIPITNYGNDAAAYPENASAFGEVAFGNTAVSASLENTSRGIAKGNGPRCTSRPTTKNYPRKMREVRNQSRMTRFGRVLKEPARFQDEKDKTRSRLPYRRSTLKGSQTSAHFNAGGLRDWKFQSPTSSSSAVAGEAAAPILHPPATADPSKRKRTSSLRSSETHTQHEVGTLDTILGREFTGLRKRAKTDDVTWKQKVARKMRVDKERAQREHTATNWDVPQTPEPSNASDLGSVLTTRIRMRDITPARRDGMDKNYWSKIIEQSGPSIQTAQSVEGPGTLMPPPPVPGHSLASATTDSTRPIVLDELWDTTEKPRDSMGVLKSTERAAPLQSKAVFPTVLERPEPRRKAFSLPPLDVVDFSDGKDVGKENDEKDEGEEDEGVDEEDGEVDFNIPLPLGFDDDSEDDEEASRLFTEGWKGQSEKGIRCSGVSGLRFPAEPEDRSTSTTERASTPQFAFSSTATQRPPEASTQVANTTESPADASSSISSPFVERLHAAEHTNTRSAATSEISESDIKLGKEIIIIDDDDEDENDDIQTLPVNSKERLEPAKAVAMAPPPRPPPTPSRATSRARSETPILTEEEFWSRHDPIAHKFFAEAAARSKNRLARGLGT